MSRSLEITITGCSWLCGIVLLGAVSTVIGYLLFKGFGTLGPQLLFGSVNPLEALLFKKQVFDGLFPAVVGTLLLVILSVGIAIPIGMTSGVYMAEYANGSVKKIFSLLFDILASIPSIVIGLFGFALAVFLHRHFSEKIYPSLLISSLALAFLVLPYIIRTTQIALETLPRETRLTALALGATKLQNIIYVLIPKSLSGIISGVILAIGRCAEDTAVIMLTGDVASAGVPKSLLANYEALPFYIYYISSQYMNEEELSSGYGAAIVLLGICAVLFLFAFMIQKGLAYRALYRA